MLAGAAAVCAEPVTALTATAWSYHFARKASDCEFNPGVGFEHGRNLRLHVGVYSNSDCRFSGYAGPSYAAPFLERWRAGIAVLGFTGYHSETKVNGDVQREDKVKFAPVLVLAYEGKKRGLNIGYIPPEEWLQRLRLTEDDGKEKFDGLLFVQFKVMLR